MDNRALNVLKWGIENSDVSRNDPTAQKHPGMGLDPKGLQEVLGIYAAKSDAELMEDAMKTITDPNTSLDAKIAAFKDFELLVEGIDNANNLENGQLWRRLVDQLEHEEDELRRYAAWCVGIAVQNNRRGQERLLAIGTIPTLVNLATEDLNEQVRRKAVFALSCASRNFQPGLDTVVEKVPPRFKPKEKLDAADMSSVDSLIDQLKEDAARAR
ncbi:Fes1-domain-containing protein [Zopfia rhizophila CBS 207.26]|uniref:Fes1-domain-containing protein n=1 Tax=Zopfia rhizophila CBS 207.26 TaxID=1314779 RepID=A0A6A6DW79_9PEZI|nr:Fes1-domain-containing protein [Zopfia rhizophila CBS 207.26]